MPADVVARARTRFEVTHRDLPTPMGPDDLRAALRDYDAVLPTLGDLFKADVFADVPKPRAKILANFGVGYNHRCPRRWPVCHQHSGCCHRRHSRHRPDADPDDRPPRG